MTTPQPLDDVIGVCRRCDRYGLLNRTSRVCTGIKEVTPTNDIIYRSQRCNEIALQKLERTLGPNAS